jgi:hypothetical protein
VGVTRCVCRGGGPIIVGTVPESGRLPGASPVGWTPLSMARLGLYSTQHRRAVARAAAGAVKSGALAPDFVDENDSSGETEG